MPTFSDGRRLDNRAPGPAIDTETIATVALLSAVLVVGLATAPDYALTVDEFNTDDYGPKALAWYTSGFTDRSHFETVEFSLWYYGPWFHILIAYVQLFDVADRITVRHAMTFLVGLAGLAALLPLGRLVGGRWVGLTAIVLCLMTGYVYGSLFFTPIDVPFLAAMTWATLAIAVMARQVLPSWPSTLAAGVLTGLAIATRTGGIITHAYLLGAMLLCATEFFAVNGRMTARYLVQIVMRCAAVVGIGWLTAIALWPWLQIGNPLQQFKTALVHFANMPMAFEFPHWGERIWTNALPRSYIPNELLARLPEAFLILLAVALVCAIRLAVTLLLETRWRPDRKAAVREAILALARERGILLVCLAVILPLAFLIVQRATIYDGVRHVLFVIPMLALLAGVGLAATLPLLGRAPLAAALVGGTYAGVVVLHLARLHPLEYVAINAFAGGTREAYDKFEQDYWSAAATEGLRRLERRLDYEPSFRKSETPPSILICIPWRDRLVGPMLQRPWVLETDPDKADFIIATQRWRCADGKPLILIDEVQRFDRSLPGFTSGRSGTIEAGNRLGGRLSTERPDELADQEYAARLIRSGARRKSLARLNDGSHTGLLDRLIADRHQRCDMRRWCRAAGRDRGRAGAYRRRMQASFRRMPAVGRAKFKRTSENHSIRHGAHLDQAGS